MSGTLNSCETVLMRLTFCGNTIEVHEQNMVEMFTAITSMPRSCMIFTASVESSPPEIIPTALIFSMIRKSLKSDDLDRIHRAAQEALAQRTEARVEVGEIIAHAARRGGT